MLRRVLLVLVVMVSFVATAATPAAAPEWCPTSMIDRQFRLQSWWTGNFVAAELSRTGNGYGQLRARTHYDDTGPWEVFRLVCVQGPDVYAIKSVANNRYVSAEISWGGSNNGLLRARATSIGPWERFRIPNRAVTTIFSLANNRYVTTEVGWSGGSNGSLRARATAVGDWEYYDLW